MGQAAVGLKTCKFSPNRCGDAPLVRGLRDCGSSVEEDGMDFVRASLQADVAIDVLEEVVRPKRRLETPGPSM